MKCPICKKNCHVSDDVALCFECDKVYNIFTRREVFE